MHDNLYGGGHLDTTFVSNVKALLQSAERGVIISHYNPDGDALGSCLGLYNFLVNKVPELHVVMPNDFPDFLKWMSESDKVLCYTKHEVLVTQYIEKADIIFCLDFNAFSRVSKMETVLQNASAKKILIDHHIQPDEKSFDLIYSTTAVSSTSEMVFELIQQLKKPEEVLSEEAAACIYAGMATDTGSFSYACNYPKTFRTVAELIECGIDTEDIHHKIYDTYSENRLRLLGFCLSECMVVNHELKTAYIYLSKKDLYRFSYKTGDLEGIVNYTLSMDGIEFGALFTEREDRIRISFRSKKRFDVNDFSRKHFNGGGHKNAAGGNAFDTLENTIIKFQELLPLYRSELCCEAGK